ncbi:MAG: flagellar motor switch protein FliN, partial [Treponema sp.]|nr:flagellar motor switch protein FliN [Treponema sp.]
MPQDTFALFTYPLNIDGTPYTLWEAVSGPVADGMVKALGGGEPAPAPQQATGAAQQFNQQPMMGMGMSMGGMSQVANTPNVQSLQFPNLQQVGGTPEQGNIGLIMDVFMEMTVELGRTKKTIKDILGMGEGTIIELDKLAGEPVDILVNHKPIAKGEVVVIDENFGVRVTEILPALEHVAVQM